MCVKICISSKNSFDLPPVIVCEVLNSQGSWMKANCFLDLGSTNTLSRNSFTNSLRIRPSATFDLKFDVAGGMEHQEPAQDFHLTLRPMNSKVSYEIISTSIRKPCNNQPAIPKEIFSQNEYLLPYINQIQTEGGTIDILIGRDYAPLIQPKEIICSPINSDLYPSVAVTSLGCYLFGGIQSGKGKYSNINFVEKMNYVNEDKLQELNDNFNHFYQSELLGVKPSSICVCSDQEISESSFIKHVRNTTTKTPDSRVKMKMPWKSDYPEKLPNNFVQAYERLKSREKQLTPEELDIYNKEFTSLYERGCVRYLTPEEVQNSVSTNADNSLTSVGSAWYLDYHIIDQPDKSTKKRLVWNSAKKYLGVCLNDGFHKGPNYINSLFTCILAWRWDLIAFSGDIEKMFMHILLAGHSENTYMDDVRNSMDSMARSS